MWFLLVHLQDLLAQLQSLKVKCFLHVAFRSVYFFLQVFFGMIVIFVYHLVAIFSLSYVVPYSHYNSDDKGI
jgi:hypothetical protein